MSKERLDGEALRINLARKSLDQLRDELAEKHNLKFVEEYGSIDKDLIDLFTLDEIFNAGFDAGVQAQQGRIEKYEAALNKILGQPFEGSWDTQAVYIQGVLAKLAGEGK